MSFNGEMIDYRDSTKMELLKLKNTFIFIAIDLTVIYVDQYDHKFAFNIWWHKKKLTNQNSPSIGVFNAQATADVKWTEQPFILCHYRPRF